MKTIKMPKSLHDVFGEEQTLFQIVTIALGAIITTLVTFFFYDGESTVWWKACIGWLFAADVFAGCIANFSAGTNEFYAKRPLNRWIFIVIHWHLLVIVWALGGEVVPALWITGTTLVGASLVNCLSQSRMQSFVGGVVLLCGLLINVYFVSEQPLWQAFVSIAFFTKVSYAFAVNHYRGGCDA